MLIPDSSGIQSSKDLSVRDEPADYQVVGRVMAYQAYDGYRALAGVPAEGH